MEKQERNKPKEKLNSGGDGIQRTESMYAHKCASSSLMAFDTCRIRLVLKKVNVSFTFIRVQRY